jgi:hypothetical protein
VSPAAADKRFELWVRSSSVRQEISGRRDVFHAHLRQYVLLMRSLLDAPDAPLSPQSIDAGMSQEEKEWLISVWRKPNSFRSFLDNYVFSHIKYFDDTTADDDPTNVYMEREWRVVGHVNFGLSDVRRIFLPEEFAERFRADLPEYAGQLTFSGGLQRGHPPGVA